MLRTRGTDVFDTHYVNLASEDVYNIRIVHVSLQLLVRAFMRASKSVCVCVRACMCVYEDFHIAAPVTMHSQNQIDNGPTDISRTKREVTLSTGWPAHVVVCASLVTFLYVTLQRH